MLQTKIYLFNFNIISTSIFLSFYQIYRRISYVFYSTLFNTTKVFDQENIFKANYYLNLFVLLFYTWLIIFGYRVIKNVKQYMERLLTILLFL